MRRVHMVLDFDGTITQADTINTLATSAIALQKARHGRNLDETWQDVVGAYVADYERFRTGYMPAEEARSSVEQEMDYLTAVKPVEEASLDRVGRSAVFEGLDDEDLYQMGVVAARTGKIVLRNGFGELVEMATERQWPIDIVSVNWSRAFIRGVLHEHSTIRTLANDVAAPSGEIKAPPLLDTRMTTAPDKLKALRNLSAAGSDADATVYFGDSTTDLACLLWGTGGVIVAADSRTSLMQTMDRIGKHAPHVGDLGAQPLRLVWARDFREVLESKVLENWSAGCQSA